MFILTRSFLTFFLVITGLETLSRVGEKRRAQARPDKRKWLTSDCVLPLGAGPRRAVEFRLAGSGSVSAAVGGEEDNCLLSCIYPDSHADHTPSKNVLI